ncbi:phosphate signaling complex protein PhoU [Desulfovibrio sp. OttesenSCG-928-F20]|nr:phosphate signaling complex protein PhoU [Desulfovibrio sp. OttesenSCG-928-M16]MDL2291154.1 phosphate signaling complex protein PhoU [Desulfovibrio sp. OttesenSCG-928-F20]
MTQKGTQLEQSIAQLRTRLLVMCACVGIAVDEACDALTRGNMGKACATVDGDAAINALENDIDEMALSILVRNQPVAQDLRFVVAALRMVIDLERIGDEAVNIAERAMLLHEALPGPVMDAVSTLMETAKKSYRRSIEVFRILDGDKALTLCRNDDESTQEEVKALHRIMEHFCLESHAGDGGKSYTGMHGILICRALNRICRRSANIAEHTYFIAEGVNIKHVLMATD